MKRKLSTGFKKIWIYSICGLLSMMITPRIIAQQTDAVKELTEVKYIGSNSEAFFFTVKYDNRTGEKFNVIVIDVTGDVLFRDTYRGRNFEKKFKIPRIIDTDEITFVIRSLKESVDQQFNVKISSRVVDDVVVKRN